MDKDKIIESLKLRPGISNVDNALLADMVQDALYDVAEYIHQEVQDIPESLGSVIKHIVLAEINRIGNEGVSSEAYSGVSRNFLDDLSDRDKRKLKSKRVLPNVIFD